MKESRVAQIYIKKQDLASQYQSIFKQRSFAKYSIPLNQYFDELKAQTTNKHLTLIINRQTDTLLLSVVSNQSHKLAYYQNLFDSLTGKNWQLKDTSDPDHNPILLHLDETYDDIKHIISAKKPHYSINQILVNEGKIKIYLQDAIHNIQANNIQNNTEHYEQRDTTDIVASRIDHLLTKYHHCLVDVGTGGGKTYMSIHAVGRLCKKANLLIITTPSKRDTFDWDASVDAYNRTCGTHLRSYTYHYNLLANSRNFCNHLLPFIKEMQLMERTQNIPCVIILDESHRSNNTTSNTVKHLNSIRKFFRHPNSIFLTATPIGNSLVDMTTNLVLTGFYANKTDFNTRRVKFFNQYHQPIVRLNGVLDLDCFKEPETLLKEIEAITVKLDTSKLVPPVKYFTKNVQIPDDLIDDYASIAQAYRDGEYDSIAEAISEQRTWLAEHYQQIGILNYLKSIIDNPQRPQDGVLLFYQYNAELHVLYPFLKQQYPDWNIQQINGQISHSQKKEALKPPKDPQHTIYLIQYQSGSEALNAPWSHTSVLVAPTNSYIQFAQCLGRNRRSGQKGTVYQFRIIIDNTLYAHIWYDCLDQKKDFDTKLQKHLLETSSVDLD